MYRVSLCLPLRRATPLFLDTTLILKPPQYATGFSSFAAHPVSRLLCSQLIQKSFFVRSVVGLFGNYLKSMGLNEVQFSSTGDVKYLKLAGTLVPASRCAASKYGKWALCYHRVSDSAAQSSTPRLA